MEVIADEGMQSYEDYMLVEKAIKYIEMNYLEQPTLEEIAQNVNVSKYHFQRVFTRWAGISPNKFLQYITISHAKKLLQESKSILDVTNEVGLSSTSRLFDLFVNFEAITPGEYKKQGDGLEVIYGVHFTQFGECLIAITERGICSLNFINEQNFEELLENLKNEWYKSKLIYNNEKTKSIVERIFSPEKLNSKDEGLKVLLKGTNFQIKVWEALLNIKFGKIVSYRLIAGMIGKPAASRAVGNALAKNPIAYIIPCHRVIRDIGVINNYRWGNSRKKAIIGWEAAKSDSN
jgi:AraC family transcriptional regulator, regulatory protein of adaptative response / methylated-DNA-[protein]-cysteine methyltransferase